MPAYQLGQFRFAFTGEDPIMPHLFAEFDALRVDGDDVGDLVFHFGGDPANLAGATRLPLLQVTETCYAAHHGALSYQVCRTETAKIRVVIRSDPLSWKQRLAPDWLIRAIDWNYLTPHETIAKNFIYGIFDYLTQIAQLRVGQSYLHASGIERDGQGIAVVAWGGIGKTSSMLNLVLEDGWRYLSDDLVAIDSEGVLWRSPKRLQIYPYNVAGQPRRRAGVLNGRSPLDRAAWWWRQWMFGPKRVRRRIPAENLFGPARIASHAVLTHALFLERANRSDFYATPIPVAVAARRAATTLLHELQPFTDLSVAMHSGEWTPVLPSVIDAYDATVKVLEAAIGRVQPWNVVVPLRADPDAIASELRGLISDLSRDDEPVVRAARTLDAADRRG